MAKNTYVGIDNKTRKIKNLYVGIDGKARKVTAGYIGVNGIAQQFYGTSIITIPTKPSVSDSYTYTGSSITPNILNYNTDQLTATGETSAVNVGNHVITFTPKPGYCWDDGSVTGYQVTWTIGKATPTITTNKSSISVSYNASTTMTVSRQGTGTITVRSNDTSICTVSGTTSVTIKGVSGGSTSITISVAADDNYNANSKNISVSVTDSRIVMEFDRNARYQSYFAPMNVNGGPIYNNDTFRMGSGYWNLQGFMYFWFELPTGKSAPNVSTSNPITCTVTTSSILCVMDVHTYTFNITSCSTDSSFRPYYRCKDQYMYLNANGQSVTGTVTMKIEGNNDFAPCTFRFTLVINP